MLYNDLSERKLTKDEEIQLLKEEIRFLKHKLQSFELADHNADLHTCSFCNVTEKIKSNPVVGINPHWICDSCKQKIQKQSTKLLNADC